MGLFPVGCACCCSCSGRAHLILVLRDEWWWAQLKEDVLASRHVAGAGALGEVLGQAKELLTVGLRGISWDHICLWSSVLLTVCGEL